MSSQHVLSSYLLPLMKDVSEALTYDRQERNEDAYRKYLECVLRVATGLLKNLYADEGHVIVTKDVEKMVKLGQQCMDRVASIVNVKIEKVPKSSVKKPTCFPIAGSPGPPWSRPPSVTTPTATPTTPVNASASITSPVTKDQPFDSVSLSASITRKLRPMEMATRQNQQLLVALRKRQAQAKNKSISTNLSLTLQRKMAENLAIARAQEEALAKKMKERQQRLEEQAAKRFHTPLGLSEEELQQRQVYKKVLEFEQENLWMIQLRKRFEESPGDLDSISALITAVLSCEAHPLTSQLQEHQKTILDKISNLVKDKLDKVENIKVPLPESAIERSEFKEYLSTFKQRKASIRSSQSESSLKEIDDESTSESWDRSHDKSDQSTDKSEIHLHNVDSEIDTGSDTDSKNKSSSETLHTEMDSVGDIVKACTDTKKDIEKALIEGDKIKTKLEMENKRAEMFSKQDSKDYELYNQENMDDLFDDDGDDDGGDDDDGDDDDKEEDESNELEELNNEEDNDKNASCDNACDTDREVSGDKDDMNTTGSKTGDVEASTDKPQAKGETLKKNVSFENLVDKIAQLRNEGYHRHLKGISEDILTYVEKTEVLFVIVFEQLDSAEGRDQCNVLLEAFFFKPIWKKLLVLFRLANEPKELALATIMTEYQSCTPEMFSVRERLCLQDKEGTSYYPYQSVVTELAGVINYQTMLDKLDCLVRASKQVMQCVEQFYKQRNEEVPSIGADDLLPVLCYIVVRSALPQLVSECQAMEKFIHEGYMFGEEGYCLTSFQTAINYLISEQITTTRQSTKKQCLK